MIGDEEGFTLIELLVAVAVLLVGVLGAAGAFNAARTLSSVAERQSAMAHRSQLELDRVASLPYSQVALTATPATSTSAFNPGYYVTLPTGACPVTPSGGTPSFQPDQSSGVRTTTTEPLVINGCAYPSGGTAVSGGVVVPSIPWSDGTMNGSVYDYVTYATDPNCAGGAICPATNDYKRVTVVVTISGVAQPTSFALVSTLIADPSSTVGGNPIKSPTCTLAGSGASCNNAVSGTPVQYFLSDTPYNGTYAPPACTGNALHQTLNQAVTILGVPGLGPGTPDQLVSSVPTGACTTPPCYAGCTTPGLPIVPTGTGTCVGGPPNSSTADNSKVHSWVTAPIAAGTTLNLNGIGGMTTYLESTTGVAVSATVCVGLYIVPDGLLGGLTGNLLAQPIGAAAQIDLTAEAGVPTPVSFNFNVGAAGSITSTALNLARLEVVFWIAASANTNVALAYDQAQLASQVTLMTT